ncbi:MAG TPA: PaaI family thioesterase [Candidatus Angelobacter sp.]|nr:PaaI family thioesterase [Candidatus Angelobacter sp.]
MKPHLAKHLEYGVVPPAEAKALSGYELVKRILEGRYPAPPIAKVFGFVLSQVEPGRVVFTGQPAFDYYNPLGSVHGGFAATMLDSCMGCSVHSMLPAGTGYTTLEIKISFLRAIKEDTGLLSAEGKAISVGKRVGTAEGRIVDAGGKLYAHGTTTCLIFPL